MTESNKIPESLTPYLTPIFSRKPLGVTAIDVRALTSYTDTLVIVEASSHRQSASLAQHVLKSLKEQKITVIGSEGIKQGEWALLDYGDIVIHIFESEAKEFYDLEGFWADAPRYQLPAVNETVAPRGDE